VTVISTQDLTKHFGAHCVLSGATLTIENGERVALVGANGSGKSTLGRILAGLDAPDTGVVMRQRGARIGYLDQKPVLPPELTAREAVLAGLHEWRKARERYQDIGAHLAEAREPKLSALLAEQSALGGEIERLGGWDLEHRADAVLQQLGLGDPTARVEWLSGGEKRRVALAQLLLSAPDLMVLDEPTNHLDIQSIDWLEKHLASETRSAVLLITHDRYFLDRVVTRTLELARGELRSYVGGWEEYLEAKAERAELEARTESNRQNFLRTELDWLRRQPKARTTKQKARIERAQTAITAPRPQAAQQAQFDVASQRQGSTILELEAVQVRYGERTLLENLDLILIPGERVGVLGPSGAGKTSLLRLVVGEQQPQSGQVRLGKNTRITYFAQSRAELDETLTIAQNVAGAQQVVDFGSGQLSIYSYLQRFLFRTEEIHKKVGVLSGGERARVALAKLLLKPANLLVLDEPTNDLDVETMGVLESMLCDFAGSVVLVSHDRYFLDRIATSLLVFEGQAKVVRYEGGYTTYTRLREERQALAVQAAAAATSAAVRESTPPAKAARGKKSNKLSYLEQRELEGMEQAVEQADAKASELAAELQRVTQAPQQAQRREDAARALSLADELAQAQQRVADLMDRWQLLESKLAGTDAN
jgi:ABC transport system ATP-binding/permease protein